MHIGGDILTLSSIIQSLLEFREFIRNIKKTYGIKLIFFIYFHNILRNS